MSIPLSQLMQNPADPELGPPTATFPICLSPSLSEELEKATDRYTDLEAKVEEEKERLEDNRERPSKRGRLGHKGTLAELQAEAQEAAEVADSVRARMEEKSVVLTVRADEDAWAEACRTNPARDKTDDPAGARLDVMWAFGLCNIDALISVADKFITRYGGEHPSPGMWEFVCANSAKGDRDRLASKIVRLHTQGVDLGKSRLGLRSSRKIETDSE